MSSRLQGIIVAASLIVATGCGPAGAEELQLNVKAPAAEPAPETGVNLGGGFIEFLLTGRIAPTPRRDAPVLQPAPSPAASAQAPAAPQRQEQELAGPRDGDVTIVAYQGSFEPGSVILNVTKKEVYRILPDGKMAVYRNDETQVRLARAILKQTGR